MINYSQSQNFEFHCNWHEYKGIDYAALLLLSAWQWCHSPSLAVFHRVGDIPALGFLTRAQHRAFREAYSVGHWASSKAKGDWGLFFVVPVNYLGVDSTFEQSENIAITVVSSSSCCWPASRGVVYVIIGSKFMLLSSVHVHYTNSWHTCMYHGPVRVMILFRCSLSMWAYC